MICSPSYMRQKIAVGIWSHFVWISQIKAYTQKWWQQRSFHHLQEYWRTRKQTERFETYIDLLLCSDGQSYSKWMYIFGFQFASQFSRDMFSWNYERQEFRFVPDPTEMDQTRSAYETSEILCWISRKRKHS